MNLKTPMAVGNTAKIYLYNNKIYKVFNDHLPETSAFIEFEKHKFAYSCGLSVPKIIDVTKTDGKQTIIMEFIKGRTMGEIVSENPEQAEYYLNISIDSQQKIHEVEVKDNSIEHMIEKLSRQINSVKGLENRCKSALIQKMKRLTPRNRLCHGDYHLYNLIMSGNNVTIIDWVDSSAGDPCADVYRTYLLYSHFSKELAEMYLGLYCKKSGLEKDDVFQWAPIIAAARMSEIVPSENPERLIKIINQYCAY